MIDTAKKDWSTDSLLEQLRPEPGWRLDRACIASYSADIRVIAAALLALSGTGPEPEFGSPTQLVRAFRDLRSRVAFVFQRGRILWPKDLPKAAALLDRFIFEAPCDEARYSWHPKFAVMKWRRIGHDNEIGWRVWIGSRNLTRDLARDVGLLLVQAPGELKGHTLPGIRDAVVGLQKYVPNWASRFTPSDLQELARVKWKLPPGISGLEVTWLDGGKNYFPTLEAQSDIVAITPFVDAHTIKCLSGWVGKGGAKATVVSSESELSTASYRDPTIVSCADLRICGGALEEGTPYELPPPADGQDVGDAEREVDRSDEVRGFHAKIIYARSKVGARLWMGSPNLTHRGWSRNFEISVSMSARKRSDPWAHTVKDIACRSNQFESVAAIQFTNADALEKARTMICAKLDCHQRRSGDEITLVARHWPKQSDTAIELFVSLPWQGSKRVLWPWGQAKLKLDNVELSACSDYLLFVLCHGDAKVGWMMHAPFFPALDRSRDTAAIRDYLKPEGYLALLCEEFRPGHSAETAWDEPRPSRNGDTAVQRYPVDAPTLEGLLKLAMRDPERLRAVAGTVAMLQGEMQRVGGDESISVATKDALAAFDELWQKVGTHLVQRADGSQT